MLSGKKPLYTEAQPIADVCAFLQSSHPFGFMGLVLDLKSFGNVVSVLASMLAKFISLDFS